MLLIKLNLLIIYVCLIINDEYSMDNRHGIFYIYIGLSYSYMGYPY